MKTPLLAGVLTAAGGLVFIADLNGQVVALDPQSGAVEWNGKVAVAAGMNSPLWPVVKATAKVVVFGVSS